MSGVKGQHRKNFKPADVSRARQRAWQSMRIHREFNQREIQGSAPISKDNLSIYLKRLIGAGFVVLVKERENGQPGSFNTYRLTRNTGPRAPIPWRDGGVFDPNTDTTHPAASPQKET